MEFKQIQRYSMIEIAAIKGLATTMLGFLVMRVVGATKYENEKQMQELRNTKLRLREACYGQAKFLQ
jgi:hypothetical protein